LLRTRDDEAPLLEPGEDPRGQRLGEHRVLHVERDPLQPAAIVDEQVPFP
jgi:hypothetical protein